MLFLLLACVVGTVNLSRDTAEGDSGAAPDALQSSAVQVATGGDWACVRMRNGFLECRGAMGTPAGQYTSIVASDGGLCAQTSGGEHVCWDRDVVALGAWDQLALGDGWACGLLRGSLQCWGTISEPPPGDYWSGVRGRGPTACALGDDGSVACWGGSTVSDPGPWFAVDVGSDGVACGLTTARTLAAGGGAFCWGREPEMHGGAFADIATSNAGACAIGIDGTVYCWGNDALSPAPLAASDVINVDAAADYACAVDVGGGVACWGDAPRGLTDWLR